MLPDPIKNFVEKFSVLPSIGPRQATRLAFHIAHSGQNEIYNLAKTIAALQSLRTCPECFFVTQSHCPICADPRRQHDVVCLLEKETDLISLEKAGKYNGVYLVLGELGKTGSLTSEHKLKLTSLKKCAPWAEIILAINPTAYGDLNAALIYREIKPLAQKITRLGRGIPTGGEIEFADPDTLGGALANRN